MTAIEYTIYEQPQPPNGLPGIRKIQQWNNPIGKSDNG